MARLRGLARPDWTWLMPPLAVGLVIAPMVLTSRTYASDWSNNLWLLWQQTLNVEQLGHPSYFVQSSLGAFYPQFLFYGGTLYSIAAYAATIAGEHPLAAYVGCFLFSIAAAYAGWLWLCVQLGLSGWRAHVPAILFVTSSYYVTNIYGRGDIGETVATSAIPLVLACALHVLGARRAGAASLALLAVAVVFLTGSHPLTLVWGSTILALLVVALLPVVWRTWRARPRRLALIGLVALLAVGVNAWTLVPTLAYHARVFHGSDTAIQQTWYSTPGVLFGVLRDTANPSWITGDVQTQGPVLAVAWVLVACAICWRSAPGAIRRAVLGLGALLVFLLWLTLSPGVLGSLPSPWSNLQFPFRLVTYVTLVGCGLVAAGLLMLPGASPRVRRSMEAAIALVTLLSIVLAVMQAWGTPSFFFKSRSEVFASSASAPRSFYEVYKGPDFADTSAPIVQPTLGGIEAGIPLAQRPGIQLPPGPAAARRPYPIVIPGPGTIATNVATGPYLVTVKGATPAGRTPGGFMVLRLSGTPGERETLTFSTTPSRALRVGLILTFVSLACLAALLVALVVRNRRTKRGWRASSKGPDG